MNNNIFKVLITSALLMTSFTSSFAQSSETASASVTVVTPISIARVNNMSFGNVAVSATTPGTVILNPNGTRSSTSGVTLPATTGTFTAASFTVEGASGYTYAITLPSSIVITDGASNTMTVNGFTSTPSGTGTLTGGTSTLSVGATLNVIAAQVAGAYTHATGVAVTVNYN